MTRRPVYAAVFAASIPFAANTVGAAVRPYATPAPVSCAIPKPCAMFTNTGTGAALEGASASGAGLFGTSSSGVYDEPGIDGESSDPDGEDAAGAFGLNVIATGIAPQYGVLAYGNGIGLAGEENSDGTSVSSSGYGVYGQDSTGTASASGDFNVGTVGAATVGTGLLGESNGSPVATNIYGSTYFGSVPIGVYGVANTAAGTHFGTSYAFFGETDSTQGYGLALVNTAANTSAQFLAANGDLINTYVGGEGFEVDAGGNAYFSGSLTTSKGTYVRSTGASGSARIEYADRATVPQMEDVGEGRLVGGRAYVTIDARLANSIDRRTAYHVFVTPEGDCNQLYVTRKSAGGFEVDESHGGRTSLAFEYRIVAKPLDETGVRLAIAPPLGTRSDDDFGSGRKSHRVSMPPLSPQERLKRRIGTQAYAQAMLRFRPSARSIAVAKPSAAAAPVTCAIPKPCATFTNTGTGAALEGASASGTGLFGTSSSGVYYEPGVDGESSDPDGEDAAGAFGLNVIATGVAPQYGVLAYGNGIGLAGEENSDGTSVSSSGYGVYGQDSTGTVSSSGDFNVGTVGASTAGTGLLGESNGSPSASSASASGFTDFGASPIGVYAVANTVSGTTYDAAYAFFGETNSTGGYGLGLINTATSSSLAMLFPTDLISARSGTGGQFTVDYKGNGQLSGSLHTDEGVAVRSTGASGTARTEYAERTTVPQMEDVGEGQLVGGRAYVNIDAGLADSIDRRTAYHVFVMPEGDCNQLYVTRKSAAGFEIRESHAGRSTAAFEYRIVAKPLDENGARLAIAPPLKTRSGDGSGSGGKSHRVSLPPLSPQERLKRRMGTQAYAQAMLRFRASRQATP